MVVRPVSRLAMIQSNATPKFSLSYNLYVLWVQWSNQTKLHQFRYHDWTYSIKPCIWTHTLSMKLSIKRKSSHAFDDNTSNTIPFTWKAPSCTKGGKMKKSKAKWDWHGLGGRASWQGHRWNRTSIEFTRTSFRTSLIHWLVFICSLSFTIIPESPLLSLALKWPRTGIKCNISRIIV